MGEHAICKPSPVLCAQPYLLVLEWKKSKKGQPDAKKDQAKKAREEKRRGHRRKKVARWNIASLHSSKNTVLGTLAIV